MAKQTNRSTYKVPNEFYDFAKRFYEECLQNQGSLYISGENLWSSQNLKVAISAITGDNAEEDSGAGFYKKLYKQISRIPEGDNQRASAARIIVEAIHMHYAYNFRLSISARNEAMDELYEFAMYSAEQKDYVKSSALLRYGVGATGLNSQNIYGSILVLLKTAQNWKYFDGDPTSAEACWDFIDQMVSTNLTFETKIRDRSAYLSVPHVVFPDFVEDSSVLEHKQQILASFRSIWPLASTDDDPTNQNRISEDGSHGSQLDQDLYALRELLRNEGILGSQPNLSFYEPELAPIWGHDNSAAVTHGQEEMLSALLFKKQIILHGPPGTSKTHSAQSIATALIKQDAVMAYRNQVSQSSHESLSLIHEISSSVDMSKIHRLQFHPNYTYEDFIGGWQFVDGNTKFLKGYLPRLCEQVKVDRRAHVLILDEINRVDLSRVMGEAFSLLDRKMDGSTNSVELPAPIYVHDQAQQLALELPSNLYIIGTMNELDQQVELMDYAMRRRFLWFPLGFEPEVLRAVLQEQESELQQLITRPYRPFDSSRFQDDVDLFVKAAQRLNDAVRRHADLGQQFEIGHTIFFEILLHFKLAMRNGGGNKSYFYNKNQEHRTEPMAVVESVWNYSLRPLLSAYLRMKPEQSEVILSELRNIFLFSDRHE